MPRLFATLAVLCALLAIACGGGDDNTPGSDGGGTIAIATATTTVDSSNVKPTTAPTVEASAINVANEAISVEAPDGTVLKGHLYSPDGPKRQALIIVAPVDQSVWAESTQAFTSQGIAVFTFDLPGFGETGGDEAGMQTLATDIRLLTRFVISRDYPLVYLMGFDETGGTLVANDATFQDLQAVAGFVTYGYDAGDSGRPHVSLAPGASWDGEDALANADVQEQVRRFVLGN